MRHVWKYLLLVGMFLWVLQLAIDIEIERREYIDEDIERQKLLKELRDLTSTADSLVVEIEVTEFSYMLAVKHLEFKQSVPPVLLAKAGRDVIR